MNFLHELKIARLRKEFNQQQFGKLVGVSGQAVSNIETGRAIPRAKTVEKILQNLEIPEELKNQITNYFNETRLRAKAVTR